MYSRAVSRLISRYFSYGIFSFIFLSSSTNTACETSTHSPAELSHHLANCTTYYDIDIIYTDRENRPNYVSHLIVLRKVVYDLHVYFNNVINVCGASSFDDITPITSHRRAIAFWRTLLMNVRSDNCRCRCPARTNNIRVAASSRRHTVGIPHTYTYKHVILCYLCANACAHKIYTRIIIINICRTVTEIPKTIFRYESAVPTTYTWVIGMGAKKHELFAKVVGGTRDIRFVVIVQTDRSIRKSSYEDS